MTMRVTILNAVADRNAVTIDVRFLAVDGPYAGASLDKQFVYNHPASVEEIVLHLTDFASMLKVSLDAPTVLEGMEFDV